MAVSVPVERDAAVTAQPQAEGRLQESGVVSPSAPQGCVLPGA